MPLVTVYGSVFFLYLDSRVERLANGGLAYCNLGVCFQMTIVMNAKLTNYNDPTTCDEFYFLCLMLSMKIMMTTMMIMNRIDARSETGRAYYAMPPSNVNDLKSPS